MVKDNSGKFGSKIWLWLPKVKTVSIILNTDKKVPTAMVSSKNVGELTIHHEMAI